MKEVLVLGDGACPSDGNACVQSPLLLNTVGSNANVRLQIDVFRTKFLRELPERLDDLLRLAAFIYAADTRVSRGREEDVFGERWTRRLRMVLPVWDLDFWSMPIIQDALADTLHFLTGDEYAFEFVQRESGAPDQGIFQFKDLLEPLPSVDVVIPFSGKTDSLAAVLEAHQEGRRPILVSHRSAPPLDSRQKNLVQQLRQRFDDWSFPHISMWVHRRGDRRVEFSQRSRSFLFTSLGVVTADLLDTDEVRLCDNGVISINLPQSGQNIGTFLTRSTHPHYLELVQSLMRDITKRNGLSIHNTLLFKTKQEALNVIATSGHPELLQETVSCAHPERRTKLQPHCGVCTQCIDRRFASEAAGLNEYDLVKRYEKDIFIHPLPEGTQRTHVENYVRFALNLEKMPSPDAFFEAFPELFDCLPTSDDIEAFAQALWGLFQRHQRTVNSVVEKLFQKYAPQIRQASLPTTCLIRIVITGQHAIDPRIRLVERLRSLLCNSLPAAFQTQKAQNEPQVQDVGEAVLQAAQEQLYRETP